MNNDAKRMFRKEEKKSPFVIEGKPAVGIDTAMMRGHKNQEIHHDEFAGDVINQVPIHGVGIIDRLNIMVYNMLLKPKWSIKMTDFSGVELLSHDECVDFDQDCLGAFFSIVNSMDLLKFKFLDEEFRVVSSSSNLYPYRFGKRPVSDIIIYEPKVLKTKRLMYGIPDQAFFKMLLNMICPDHKMMPSYGIYEENKFLEHGIYTNDTRDSRRTYNLAIKCYAHVFGKSMAVLYIEYIASRALNETLDRGLHDEYYGKTLVGNGDIIMGYTKFKLNTI